MKIEIRQAAVHIVLFVVTFVTTTLAGAEWVHGVSAFQGFSWNPGFTWNDFLSGMSYSVPFLLILTIHEFGHYFTAVYNRVDTTLPYYIPLPPMTLMLGTLGAVIRLKAAHISKKQHFDIGIAGPLAGFVVSLAVLVYGFTHLPPPEYIFQFHPEYERYGLDYANYVYQADHMMIEGVLDVTLGKNLIYLMFEKWVADPARIPNVHEIMHYPYLFAGLLSLVFTGLNLLPVGQLDGGHVLYGLLGKRGHQLVASVVFSLFLLYAGLGYLNFGAPARALAWRAPLFVGFLYLCMSGLRLGWKDTLLYTTLIFTAQYLAAVFVPQANGYSGWLFFIFLVSRFVGVAHPASEDEEPLSRGRQILGWAALALFVLCFTPRPIDLVVYMPPHP